MCELEQHISELVEGGGPLSPSKILLNISVGCRMGGGNQEDAHEFLRYSGLSFLINNGAFSYQSSVSLFMKLNLLKKIIVSIH